MILPDLFQLEAKVKNFASQHKFYDSIPSLHDGFINPNHVFLNVIPLVSRRNQVQRNTHAKMETNCHH